ncbi:MAG: DNA polymerase [Bacteroides thetaiotaomicron]
MRYHHYSQVENAEYPLCILVPQLQPDEVRRTYLNPYGIDPDLVMVITLEYTPGKKKTPVADMRRYIKEELMPVLERINTQYVLCTDADYFKAFTNFPQADKYLGYVNKLTDTMNISYLPNYRTIFYDPNGVTAKIKQTMDALKSHCEGTYTDPGAGIITRCEYPTTVSEIADALERLLAMEKPLTIDVEAFSLKFHSSGIGTISFAWSKHEGIAFPVDYVPIPGATEAPYGMQVRNEEIRELLRNFFIRFAQKSIYHNITFDVTLLIYQLFMSDILDTEGLLNGLEIMMKNWDCTKLITYLATNSCAGNKLSLKDQAQKFAGNYAQTDEDIKDITRIPLDKLLEYNLVDTLSTWYVRDKWWNRMVEDDQLPVYEDHFKLYAVDIVQMQLTGFPLKMDKVKEVHKELEADFKGVMAVLQNSPIVKQYEKIQAKNWADAKNASYKVKRVTPADCDLSFNPNSPNQLKELMFDMLKLPVVGLTKTKQPSTDADAIKALIIYNKDPDVDVFLKAIQEFSLVTKILTTYIPAMLNAVPASDGYHYLFGSYNLGGTLSGRLSSSDPNLQNLPVKGKYGKKIKSCFGYDIGAGKLFGGLDFASLEDRISALTTKDPNKLKVYTDGYDGHCLRAYAYFSDQMPDIIPTSVSSINSIEKLYKELRSDSKAPTFALTYQGTWVTLVKNCGFSEQKAKGVEASFQQLYTVSIQWVDSKLDQAAKDGYVTCAFGLRVRTPLLAQVIRGTSKIPREAEAEGRSAGNALGQSWCLLNNRASAEFMKKVRASKFRLKIRPAGHIHDAQYFSFDEDLDVLMFINEHLVKAVQWQDDPVIYHDQVKLGGEFSLFVPDWNNEIVIPNYATREEVLDVVDKALNK